MAEQSEKHKDKEAKKGGMVGKEKFQTII